MPLDGAQAPDYAVAALRDAALAADLAAPPAFGVKTLGGFLSVDTRADGLDLEEGATGGGRVGAKLGLRLRTCK